MFHGLGGSPRRMKEKTQGVAGGPQIWPEGTARGGRAWLEARFEDDDFDEQVRAALPKLRAFLAEVAQCYGTPVLAGHSQGAHMAFALAADSPDLVHSVVGSAGALPESFRSQPFAMPVDVIHGKLDPGVPFDHSEEMASQMGATFWPIEDHGHSFSGALRSAWDAQVLQASQ